MGHFVADFGLQSDRMAVEKCPGKDHTLPWPWWLLAHSGIHAFFVSVITGVIYTHPARRALLGVRLVDHPGVRSSSEPYAALAAEAMRAKLDTTWGLAETGAAGPTGNRYGDAAGHTCVAVAGPITRRFTLETGDSDREANMWRFAEATLAELEAALRAAG